MERTTIALEAETRDELRALKTGGQTYDEVLHELMERYKNEVLPE
jgi:predicted CopG family antitoxin